MLLQMGLLVQTQLVINQLLFKTKQHREKCHNLYKSQRLDIRG